MKKIITLAILIAGAFLAQAGESAKSVIQDCEAVSNSFQNVIQGKTMEEMLPLLSKHVSASPDCACELVKTAILGYDPNPSKSGIEGTKLTPEEVIKIVDTSIQAAPDRMDDIIRCATAAAPDAMANPLNFPGIVGQDPRGQYTFVPNTPVFIIPPRVTRVSPN